MSMAVVYTDLDGTLLDHHTYAFDEALGAIKALKDRGIPIVPCTSKTRAETVCLMQALELDGDARLAGGGEAGEQDGHRDDPVAFVAFALADF